MVDDTKKENIKKQKQRNRHGTEIIGDRVTSGSAEDHEMMTYTYFTL